MSLLLTHYSALMSLERLLADIHDFVCALPEKYLSRSFQHLFAVSGDLDLGHSVDVDSNSELRVDVGRNDVQGHRV